jgi:hypothetical protein
MRMAMVITRLEGGAGAHALRDALLAYATGSVQCQGGHPIGLASFPACCPLRVVLTRYGILLKGQPGKLK